MNGSTQYYAQISEGIVTKIYGVAITMNLQTNLPGHLMVMMGFAVECINQMPV